MTSLTLSFLERSYIIVIDAVSNLVFGPYGWLQTVVFFVFGISVLCLDIVLLFRLKSRSVIGAVSLALVGIGFFIIGLYHGQAPGGPVTLTTTIHICATAVVICLFR